MRVTSHPFTLLLGAVANLQISLASCSSSASTLQTILDDSRPRPEYRYPTDFTREIIPIPCHSHNDYWRDRPVYSAIAAGCISIEADVWLINETLYVGHHKSSLSKERTLKSLYIDQLVKILKLQNPRTEFDPTGEYRNGVFDTDPYQTLYLFIDVKTNGTEAWKYISESLQPLRELRYLTGVVKGVKVPGPITVIGTGNTPLSLVSGLDTRDFFYDGPLSGLESRNITDLISPVASTSLTGAIGSIGSDNIPFTDAQLEIIKAQIKVAKSRKILARYWGTPGWPIRKRNEIWRALLNEGVGLLNVDDLRAVGEYF